MQIRNLVCLLLLCAAPLSMPVQAADSKGVLTVSGTGQVPVVPDLAMISVGVEVMASTAKAAISQNAEQMNRVFKLLQDSDVALADIQTSQFQLAPQWSNQKSGSDMPPEIVGFMVSNSVRVKVRELAQLGAVLDALAESGATSFHSVQFDISQPQSPLDEARKLAVAEAIRKAELLADAAGQHLGRILSIDEAGSAPVPIYRMEASLARSSPIAEGEMTISADVTMRFQLD
ncbi:MAG: SIMPL domain-containing protein [Rhodobacteraceae bacterium]|nr:SIMPL domain-containing protein [Paracoccaceae bacterium]